MRWAIALLVAGCAGDVGSVPPDAQTDGGAPHDGSPPPTLTLQWVYFTASGGACQDEPVCSVSACGGMTCTCRTCATPPCTEPYTLTQRCCSATKSFEAVHLHDVAADYPNCTVTADTITCGVNDLPPAYYLDGDPLLMTPTAGYPFAHTTDHGCLWQPPYAL